MLDLVCRYKANAAYNSRREVARTNPKNARAILLQHPTVVSLEGANQFALSINHYQPITFPCSPGFKIDIEFTRQPSSDISLLCLVPLRPTYSRNRMRPAAFALIS